jgi:hypothetical protein
MLLAGSSLQVSFNTTVENGKSQHLAGLDYCCFLSCNVEVVIILCLRLNLLFKVLLETGLMHIKQSFTRSCRCADK